MNIFNDHRSDASACGAVTFGDKLINIRINHNNNSANLPAASISLSSQPLERGRNPQSLHNKKIRDIMKWIYSKKVIDYL